MPHPLRTPIGSERRKSRAAPRNVFRAALASGDATLACARRVSGAERFSPAAHDPRVLLRDGVFPGSPSAPRPVPPTPFVVWSSPPFGPVRHRATFLPSPGFPAFASALLFVGAWTARFVSRLNVFHFSRMRAGIGLTPTSLRSFALFSTCCCALSVSDRVAMPGFHARAAPRSVLCTDVPLPIRIERRRLYAP
jgi:hypothetical protein